MKHRIYLFIAAVFLISSTLLAQTSTKAEVSGKVVTEDGTALPGVTVVLTNVEQGTKRTVITNSEGKYRAPFLPLGRYSISASMSGFTTYQAKNLVLKLGDQITYNITLKAANLSEEIVVTAEAGLIETQKIDVMTNISDEMVESLPTGSRDFKDFVMLAPGVVEAAGDRVAGDGSLGIMNNLQIDGAGYNSTFFGEQRGSTRIPFTFSQETIKEFNVISNPYSAKFGEAGGLVINAVTKSGTNEFHGSAHYFKQNDSMMNAYAPDSDTTDLEDRQIPEFDRDQFGFTVSGPIIKDKVFFFFSYDAQRKDASLYNKFREYSGYDEFASLYPEIIAANEGWWPTTEDNDVYFLKIDWQINDDNRLAFRINKQEFEAINGTSSYETTGITGNGEEHDDSTSYVLELTSILSPTLFNELRIQYAEEDRPRYANTTDQIEVEVRYYQAVFGQNQFLPNWLNEDTLEIMDDLTWNVGDHTVKTGFRYATYEYDDMFFRYGGGHLAFYGGYSELVDFLQHGADADFNSRTYYTQAFSNTNGQVIYNMDELGLYIDDAWQVNDKLLVNFGLRYQSSKYDDIQNPNPELAAMGLQGVPDDSMVTPRFALTYDVTGEGTDLIRLGAGYFAHRTPALLVANAMLTNGVNVTRLNFYPGDPLFPTSLDDRIDISEIEGREGLKPDVFVFAKDFQDPYTFKASLSYEKQLSENWKAAVDLKYTRGYHFQIKRDINLGIRDDDGDGVQDVDAYGRPLWDSWNRPNSDFNKIMEFNSDGASKSSSITFRVDRRYADKWSIHASYTLNSSYDITTNERSVSSSSNFITNPADPMDDWGRSDYYHKHQFKVYWTVELPWEVKFSGFHRFYSGRPYTATSGYDDNKDYFYNDRAVIDGELVGRNTFRQPNFAQTDIKLSKTFYFFKNQSVELMFDMFNVFDRANRTTGNTIYKYDDFGELNYSTRTPRQYQVGIKYRF